MKTIDHNLFNWTNLFMFFQRTIIETKSTRILDFGFVITCFFANLLWTISGYYMSDINVAVSINIHSYCAFHNSTHFKNTFFFSILLLFKIAEKWYIVEWLNSSILCLLLFSCRHYFYWLFYDFIKFIGFEIWSKLKLLMSISKKENSFGIYWCSFQVK